MSEQANTTAAAEVSSEYLSDIRLRARSSGDKLDGEIKDLILAARADLVRGGVLPARAADETDPLVKQAISTYVKAEFGLDTDDADKGPVGDLHMVFLGQFVERGFFNNCRPRLRNQYTLYFQRCE